MVLDGGERRWGEFLPDLIQKDPSRVAFSQVVLAQDVVALAMVGSRRS